MAKAKCTRCYRPVPIVFSEKYFWEKISYEVKLCEVCTERALRTTIGHTEGHNFELFVKSNGKEVKNAKSIRENEAGNG